MVVDVDRTKKLITVACLIGSIPMVICNRFNERLADNSRIATFMEVPLYDALVRRFQSLCSMLKILCAACPCLSQFISVQFAP